LDSFDDPVRPRVLTETYEDLVEHDVIDDRDLVDGAELFGEATSQAAAPFDEFGDACAAKLPQRSPSSEAAGSSRRLRDVVAWCP
jgi:hypothetical protein